MLIIGNDDDDAKILPSNDTDKSTDTEGVELSSYPDSSGATDSPPKVKDVLTGGKRKGGSKASRRKNKRRRETKNYKVDGGATVVHTPLGNEEVRRECLKHAVFNDESIDSPPEVEMLVGGKRKEGSKPTRRKKKSKKRNDNCRGGASFSQDNDDGPL